LHLCLFAERIIIAGYTKFYGAGSSDVYLIRTDANGATLWTRTYGGSDWDFGWSVQETQDSGFIIMHRKSILNLYASIARRTYYNVVK